MPPVSGRALQLLERQWELERQLLDEDDVQHRGRQRPPLPLLPQPRLAARFGFRSFSATGGRFLLNDRPIFLRGNSINPPGRDLPPVSATKPFALSYLRWLKLNAHINAVRIGDGVSSSTASWYDAADEVGMLSVATSSYNVIMLARSGAMLHDYIVR